MNEIKFPILRKKYPTSVKGNFESSIPLEYPIPEIKYKPKQKRIAIKGGLAHSFIKGYFLCLILYI